MSSPGNYEVNQPHAVKVTVGKRSQIAIRGLFWAIHAAFLDQISFAPRGGLKAGGTGFIPLRVHTSGRT